MKDLELNSYVIQDISSCLRMLKPYGIMYESPSVYFPNISRVDKVNFQVWKDYLAFDITIAKTNFLINVPIKSTVSLNDNNIDFQFPNGDFLVIGLDKEIETLKNGLNIFNRKDIFKESLNESKKSTKSIKESINIFDTLENAWDKSTINNNVFEKTVLKLKTDSFKDPFDKYSTIYMFTDGSSIDCDSLDPFDCEWCTYVSEDLSFVHEFKK